MQKTVTIIVKPNAREECVEKIAENELRVCVKAPAKEGKANAAVLKAVAEYFAVAPSRVVLLHGARGKRKIISVDNHI